VTKSFDDKDWPKFFSGLKSTLKLVQKKMGTISKDSGEDNRKAFGPEIREKWKELGSLVSKFDTQQEQVRNNFAFSFVEGLFLIN
jgi:hypothetical protein